MNEEKSSSHLGKRPTRDLSEEYAVVDDEPVSKRFHSEPEVKRMVIKADTSGFVNGLIRPYADGPNGVSQHNVTMPKIGSMGNPVPADGNLTGVPSQMSTGIVGKESIENNQHRSLNWPVTAIPLSHLVELDGATYRGVFDSLPDDLAKNILLVDKEMVWIDSGVTSRTAPKAVALMSTTALFMVLMHRAKRCAEARARVADPRYATQPLQKHELDFTEIQLGRFKPYGQLLVSSQPKSTRKDIEPIPIAAISFARKTIKMFNLWNSFQNGANVKAQIGFVWKECNMAPDVPWEIVTCTPSRYSFHLSAGLMPDQTIQKVRRGGALKDDLICWVPVPQVWRNPKTITDELAATDHGRLHTPRGGYSVPIGVRDGFGEKMTRIMEVNTMMRILFPIDSAELRAGRALMNTAVERTDYLLRVGRYYAGPIYPRATEHILFPPFQRKTFTEIARGILDAWNSKPAVSGPNAPRPSVDSSEKDIKYGSGSSSARTYGSGASGTARPPASASAAGAASAGDADADADLVIVTDPVNPPPSLGGAASDVKGVSPEQSQELSAAQYQREAAAAEAAKAAAARPAPEAASATATATPSGGTTSAAGKGKKSALFSKISRPAK